MADNLLRLRQLSEVKQKAVRMRAEGTTMEAISSSIDTPYPTVRSWFSGPDASLTEELDEYKAHLADKQIAAAEDLQKVCAADAMAAWARLKSIAMSDDASMPAHVSLAAVDSMLDRAGIARVSKTEGKHSIAMTDDDRRKRFADLAELQADIQPAQLLRLAGKA